MRRRRDRAARTHISKPIPSLVRIVGEPIRIWYPDQPLTCRKCGGAYHVAGGCNAPRCFNCEGPGHRAHQCPESRLCGVCLSPNHQAGDCEFITFSGNVEETGTPVAYAIALADEPGPAEVRVRKPKLAPQPPPPARKVPQKETRREESPNDHRCSKRAVPSVDNRGRRKERAERKDSSDSESVFDRYQRWKRRDRRHRVLDDDSVHRDRSSRRSGHGSSDSEDERGKEGRRKYRKH